MLDACPPVWRIDVETRLSSPVLRHCPRYQGARAHARERDTPVVRKSQVGQLLRDLARQSVFCNVVRGVCMQTLCIECSGQPEKRPAPCRHQNGQPKPHHATCLVTVSERGRDWRQWQILASPWPSTFYGKNVASRRPALCVRIRATASTA